MIIEKAIKTIILDYCIDVVFERVFRNFITLTISNQYVSELAFIHYPNFKRFIRVRRLDFAYYTFKDYLNVNSIRMSSDDLIQLYLYIWDMNEEAKMISRDTEAALVSGDLSIL